MLFAFVVLNILTIVYALPYGHSIQNLNTVVLKCPGGQLWVSGGCRDAHYLIRTALSPLTSNWQESDMSNFVTVPPNCPPDQEYGNGACRDPFRNVNYEEESDMSSSRVIILPPNCPIGQQYTNGQCRDTYHRLNLANILLLKKNPENVLHDYIRQILQNRIGLLGNSNVINSFPRITSVPRQCPLGSRMDATGRCRQRILL